MVSNIEKKIILYSNLCFVNLACLLIDIACVYTLYIHILYI